MNRKMLSLVVALSAPLLFGAGCGSAASSSSPSSVPAVTRPSNGESPFPVGSGDQASKVPADIPVYPGGMVIMVTGYGDEISVAQSTPDPVARVIEWIKGEYGRRGASYKTTDVTGASTNLVFEAGSYRYRVRVDDPVGGGGAYLTISRGQKP